MTQTAIPEDELKVFESLKDIKVVFDVGPRDDVDYLILKPDIELHLFEPNPLFVEELKKQLGDRPNVYINSYGLGDKIEERSYDPATQSFSLQVTSPPLPIKTLNWYIQENKISRIDFLKVDAEGFDYKVLLGGSDAINLARYIQYEHWDNDGLFHTLLGDKFDIYYIGGRNSICVRKGEEKPWVPETPQEGGLSGKTEKNYL